MKIALLACIFSIALSAARQPTTEPSEEPTTQASEEPTTQPSEEPTEEPATGTSASADDVPSPTTEHSESSTTSPAEEDEKPTTQPSDKEPTDQTPSTPTEETPEPTPPEPAPEREVGEFDATERYKLPFKLTLDGWMIIADSKNDRFVRILFQPTTKKKEELGVEMAALIIGASRLQPTSVSSRKEFAVFEEGYIAGRKAKAPDAVFVETEEADDLSDVPTRRGALAYGAEEAGGDPKYKSYHVLVLTKNNAIIIAMDGDAEKADEIKAELDRLLESFEWTTAADELKDGE